MAAERAVVEGDVLLIALREIDNDGAMTGEEFVCTVTAVLESTLWVQRDGGDAFSLPNGEGLYEVAEPGFYELDNGDRVENPDFVGYLVRYESEAAYELFMANSQ